jgi:sodium-independent sulfate anion transporter 11
VASVRAEYPNIPATQVASALAVLCGAFVVILGILRLGFIVDFIPLVSIAAFMTGSAINIAAGQVPAMMGAHSSFSPVDQH